MKLGCNKLLVGVNLVFHLLTVNPRISPLTLGGVFIFGFWMMAYSKGGFKIFLVVSHIPVEISLLVNYFFDARHAILQLGGGGGGGLGHQ